jgi:hypothetical protein
VAGDSITHWRQCQTRGRRFVVAFACVVEALPVPSRKHWRLPAMDGASAVWLVPALGAAAYDKLGFAMVADAAMRFFVVPQYSNRIRQRWRPQNPYTVISMSESGSSDFRAQHQNTFN